MASIPITGIKPTEKKQIIPNTSELSDIRWQMFLLPFRLPHSCQMKYQIPALVRIVLIYLIWWPIETKVLTTSNTFLRRLYSANQTGGNENAILYDCNTSINCKKLRRFGPSFGITSLYSSNVGLVKLSSKRSKTSDNSSSSVWFISIGTRSVCNTFPQPKWRRYSCVSPSRRKIHIKC